MASLVIRTLCLLIILVSFSQAIFAQSALSPQGQLASALKEKVYYDGVGANGELEGGFVYLPQPVLSPPGPQPFFPAVPVVFNGPNSNRIDFVFVGDGYLQSELGLYADQVDDFLVEIFSQEPFATYEPFFNVYRVDVVSNESGVDNDPVDGIDRDTALNMGFWLSGIERLLGVSVSNAYAEAASAPEVDHVLAVANSTKYGGAGYTSSDLATFSGGNSSSSEVAIHELGHSLGELADEYDYSNGETYMGSEPSERNVSILDVSQMQASGTKWANWLGESEANGTVGTFEGARYKEFGIFRPTGGSKMRSLGQDFNLPSIEGLIIEFYKLVNVIDDASPTGQLLNEDETLFVIPLEPVGHSLDIQWTLNGAPIVNQNVGSLQIASLNLAPGTHQIGVEVVDNTPWVRDQAQRALHMRQSLSWQVFIEQKAFVRGDMNDNGAIDIADAIFAASALFSGGSQPNCFDAVDANDDEAFDIADVISLLDYLFSTTGGSLPAPFPDCAMDPTMGAGGQGLECDLYSSCP